MKDKRVIALVIVFLIAFVMAATSPSSAKNPIQSRVSKYTDYTMVWDGITRYYRVYVPTGLPANPPLLVMLHATSRNPASSPPTKNNYEWPPLADANKFILVTPASTYNSQSGEWNWNAYYLDGAFQDPPPDDSGFLRQLITNLTAQFNIDPKRVFVAGMSSGAMMAQRVGVELSDLVAAIVPVSGQILGQATLPITLPGPPVAPVSVQEWHGTKDHILQPCNYGPTLYSGYKVFMATVDDSFNYWVSQNACTQLQTSEALCLNGKANPEVPSNDATGCQNNVEAQFVWEQNLGHNWNPKNNPARWRFMAAHPKP